MATRKHIAVIGGGPAGAFAATQLAGAGCRVTVLDEKLAWEKPCGGALTPKAVSRYPFLRDNSRPKKIVSEGMFVAANGAAARFRLREPVFIYSRYDLNSLVLERAAEAGCELVRDRVTSVERAASGWRLRGRDRAYTADFLLLAAGARSAFRQFTGALPSADVGTTLGYLVPGTQAHLEVKFLENFEGYLWIFPRADHLSVGIYGKPGAEPAARMKQRLHRYMEERGLSRSGAVFYSHLLPSLSARTMRAQRFAGDGWAAVGDAAGLVDPITGEGLYYAFRSAETLAACYAEGRVAEYPRRLRADCGFELEMAARLCHRFYFGAFLGGSVTTRMVQFMRRSSSFEGIVADLVSGAQGYLGLKRRLWANLPVSLSEIAWSLACPAGPETTNAAGHN